MSKAIRTFLFIFFALLFTAAAPSLALYAQGYRLNLPLKMGSKWLVKTGGIYIKTNPKQADVYINGKLAKQTDFFFGSVLIEDLLPRQYHIEVKKPGYQTWSKTLEVREKEVAEARNITLLSSSIKINLVEKNIDAVLPSKDNRSIALQSQNEEGWILKLYDVNQELSSKLAAEKDFTLKDARILDWSWDNNPMTLNITAENAKEKNSYIILASKSPAKITKEIASISTATSTPEVISPDEKYILDQEGYVLKKEQQDRTTRITAGPFDMPQEEKKYGLWVFDDKIFVSRDTELFVYNDTARDYDKIFDGLTSDLKISPDGKKITYSSDSEIWVLYLKEKTDQPPKSAGDKVLVARFSEKVRDCQWLNSDYLVFMAGNNIKAAEIDDRDKTNIVNLTALSSPQDSESATSADIFWNYDKKILFIYNNKELYSVKFE